MLAEERPALVATATRAFLLLSIRPARGPSGRMRELDVLLINSLGDAAQFSRFR
jgi:hypothetical protein